MAAYRDPPPYRKPQSYRGAETAPAVGVPSVAGVFRIPYAFPAARVAAQRLPWDAAASAAPIARCAWGVADSLGQSTRARHVAAAEHADQRRARWGRVHRYRKHVPYRKARSYRGWGSDADSARASEARAPWGSPARLEAGARIRFGDADEQLSPLLRLLWRAYFKHDRGARLRWNTPDAWSAETRAAWHALAARGAYVRLPWGPAGRRDQGYRVHWPVEPDPDGGSTIVVPVRTLYAMIPTIAAVRLPERTPLELLGVSITGAIDQWSWSFDAQLPYAELAKVNPQTSSSPTEIEIAINGFVWTFLVEGFDDNKRFGARNASIRGRSRTAILAEPYAPTRTYTEPSDRLAVQLADQELVDTGFTLDWDAVDWLVPAGVWSYQDLAPMDAIVRVAQAIGAAVLSDPEDKVVQVTPRYGTSPWAWGAAPPYAIVPASFLIAGNGGWQGGPNADGIYVYAEGGTHAGFVKIATSAGAEQLPMVVERLAVHADALRERGRIELAKAGRIKTETRTLPLLAIPDGAGLIPIGALLEIGETGAAAWKGQCMSVRIDAQASGSAVSVRQTITIERQFR